MRTRRLFLLLMLGCLVTMAMMALSACNSNGGEYQTPNEIDSPASQEHSHSFLNEWSYDGTYHWHSCSGCEEVRDKFEHDWNSGVITTAPTETAEGVKEYTCNTCGKTKVDSIPMLNHEHTFEAGWVSDDTYHWHAATCGHEAEISGKAEHTWDNGVVTKEASETEMGIKTYTCVICEKTKTEEISMLPHMHTYQEGWTSDDTYHWHASTCGHETEISGKAVHVWDNGVVTKEASETETGVKTFSCTICQKTKAVEIPISSHIHTYSDEWSFDEEHHWHEMNCGHEELEGVEPIIDLSEHSYDTVTHFCICGQKELVTLTFVDYNGQVFATVKKEFGTTIVIEDEIQSPVRDGYSFAGWANGESVVESISATTSIILQARYNRIYWVLFVSNNNIIDSQPVEEGGNAVLPENTPQKDGYIFEGWEDYTNITSDRTVMALYSPIQYVVTYVMPDGAAIGQSQTVYYGSTVTAPEVEMYWFNWNNYHMYMFTNWTFNGHQSWNYNNIETEVISQYNADSTKTPSIIITANFATEYNLPVVVVEEETATNTTVKENISLILPSNLSCYVYAIDLQFSYGNNLSINNDTINTSTIIYDETTTSNYNNKTRSFSFIWTSNNSGVAFSQQQIIDTIEFSRPNSQVTIGDNNFVLVNTSSIIVSASEDANYSDLQKITPIVVYKR